VREQRAGHAPTPVGSQREPAADRERARAADVVTRMQERLRRLQHEVTRGPSLAEIERTIQRLRRQLEPNELTQLRRLLTTPQAAIVFRSRQAAKEILLGRGERER
jgi:hypothetical protein